MERDKIRFYKELSVYGKKICPDCRALLQEKSTPTLWQMGKSGVLLMIMESVQEGA
ncbi:MAG: hypothetical protein STSR0009_21720 [Methanoregula sp.]